MLTINRAALPLICILLGAGLAAQDDKPGSLEGTVASALTGAPLGGAHIILRPIAKAARRKYGAIATVEGKFSINPLEPGTYEVGADLAGFLMPRGAGGTMKVEVKPGGAVRELRVRMVP